MRVRALLALIGVATLALSLWRLPHAHELGSLGLMGGVLTLIAAAVLDCGEL